VRPGHKTTQEEVRTAVVKLLQEHPEGLGFNQIFKELKGKEVLGSFSVLSHAMKDLRKAGVVKYKDVQLSRYKIPPRVYKLTEPMERELRQLHIGAREKEKVPLKKILLEETLLRHLFLTHTNNLIAAYRSLLCEDNPSDENARWKLILNLELEYIQTFMNIVAKTISEGKIPIRKAEKVAYEVHKRMM
jgi:DNA-binding transcriptional ArsR family regulator